MRSPDSMRARAADRSSRAARRASSPAGSVVVAVVAIAVGRDICHRTQSERRSRLVDWRCLRAGRRARRSDRGALVAGSGPPSGSGTSTDPPRTSAPASRRRSRGETRRPRRSPPPRSVPCRRRSAPRGAVASEPASAAPRPSCRAPEQAGLVGELVQPGEGVCARGPSRRRVAREHRARQRRTEHARRGERVEFVGARRRLVSARESAGRHDVGSPVVGTISAGSTHRLRTAASPFDGSAVNSRKRVTDHRICAPSSFGRAAAHRSSRAAVAVALRAPRGRVRAARTRRQSRDIAHLEQRVHAIEDR